jgi:hypothetical protein
MEDRCIEEVQRRVRQGVAAPVDDPAVEQRIAAIGDERAEVRGERPGQRDRQDDVQRERQNVAYGPAFLTPSLLRTQIVARLLRCARSASST